MEPNSEAMLETLRLAQRLGFFGAGPIERVVAQGELFASGLTRLGQGAQVVDLGSGGGSPGLIVAACRADLAVTLIDRRRKRTDFLMRAVRRLELDNVEVLCDDVAHLSREVGAAARPPFDGLTARGFGPFPLLVQSVVDLVRGGGVAVISDPAGSTRWSPDSLGAAPIRLVERLQAGDDVGSGVDGEVVVLERRSDSEPA